VSELQRIVDSVASRAGRPALIEDRRQRVVVYSEQTEPMDEVRRLSILQRQTTAEVIAFFREVGVQQARRALRTPSCPRLGMLPRICIPIRHGDLLLGFLWFLDADESMTDEQIAEVSPTTTELALALYRENLSGELASQRETEAIRLLLADEPDARQHGALELLDEGSLAEDGAAVAMVSKLILRPGERLDDLSRIAVEQALLDTRRWLGPRQAVHLSRYDHGVLLVRCARRRAALELPDIAGRLNTSLREAARGLACVSGAVVGVGQTRAELADLRESYDEAALAMRVAVQLPAVGPVAWWSKLGIYRVLSQLAGEDMRSTSVHPGLEKLLDDPIHHPLLETLETYLDLACSAGATAQQMNLHRTSLYYRLQRVEELADTSLKDGNERLSLHLALKVARLTGRYHSSGSALGPVDNSWTA
jgi:PucR-like helix-turn-helix protein/diguanylate cyclase with GGDEF domain